MSHKPNETKRYSQNLVGGGGLEERKTNMKSNSKRMEKSKNYYADLVDFLSFNFHSLPSFFCVLFKYLDDDNLSHSTLRKKSSHLFIISLFLFIFVLNLPAFVWQQQVK